MDGKKLNKIDGDVCWLHISDFHLKSHAEYGQDVVLRALISSLPQLTNRVRKPDFVIASGDIAFSGKAEEYALANIFFDDLLSALSLARDKLFVVPGNHDVDRNAAMGLQRTLSNQAESDKYFDGGAPIKHVESVLKNFKNWHDEYFSGVRQFPNDSTCYDLGSIQVGSRSIDICGINTAAFCRDDTDFGKLWVGRRSLDRQRNGKSLRDDELRLVVMHHPIDWLHSEEASNIRETVEGWFDVVLSGHLHENRAASLASDRNSTIYSAAGASYQTRQWPNTATFSIVSANEIQILPISYTDKPREIWTVDTSLFPDAIDFTCSFPLPRSLENEESEEEETVVNGEYEATRIGHSEQLEYSTSLARDLFVAPNGRAIFFEPRIYDRPQGHDLRSLESAVRISVSEIVASEMSFLIDSRTEYGGSTLCKHLASQFSAAGVAVVMRDATDLPNYQTKLKKEFQNTSENLREVLILDNFLMDKHEKLIRELEGAKLFKRVVAIQENKSFLPSIVQREEDVPFKFKHVFIWTVGREEIRQAAGDIFDTFDPVTISNLVDKVYNDLLGLCIPLTPANVVMYLRVLSREANYHPLNKVDILGRYLEDALRRPSDAYAESFNTKNKLDFLAEFVWALFSSEKHSFNNELWRKYIEEYSRNKLLDIDGNALLQELEHARILVNWGNEFFLKYDFFFTYFLGRYLVARPKELEQFLSSENYLTIRSIADVVTGLSSDNSLTIKTLTSDLEALIETFSLDYISKSFDPLNNLIWSNSEEEESELWKKVERDIQAGPRDSKEIDTIKTSLLEEARTADQQTKFEKFTRLETKTFRLSAMLSEALKNADDVSAEQKLAAYEALLNAELMVIQIGVLLSREIARSAFFSWGGIAFIGFNKALDPDEENEATNMMRVMTAICNSAVGSAGARIGTSKLSGVFREWNKLSDSNGYSRLVNFAHILKAKGSGWHVTLKEIIENTEHDAFYLNVMLNRLMRDLKFEINTGRNRQHCKDLIALIQTKRSVRKNLPGKKLVKRVLSQMEEKGYFAPKGEHDGSKPDH